MIARIIGLIVLFFSGSLFFVPLISAQTLKVGITSKTLFFMPFYVGQKKGFYAAENLKVERLGCREIEDGMPHQCLLLLRRA